MRLSASKIGCIFRCPREFVHRYELKTPEGKSKALLFGSAWHQTLDMVFTGKEPDLAELNAMDPEYSFADAIAAMSRGYSQGYPEHVKEIAREIKIENDVRICIIDGVQVDDDGSFWITEAKTRSDKMDDDEAMMLPSTIQVAMYANAATDVANELWLEPEKFAGIKYVMTKKPGERRKAKETKEEHGARMTSETNVLEIPKALLTTNPEPMMNQALARADEALLAFKSGNIFDVPANTAQCFRYGSKCGFFSSCHRGKIIAGGNRRILACE